MKVCKGLFFLAVLPALGLLPLVSDSEAQQRGYCPRNANFTTITKQQQTTGWYTNAQSQQSQMTYQKQQQQTSMIDTVQRQQTPTSKTSTQMSSMYTPITKTATTYVPSVTTQIQQQQQVTSKTNTVVNRTPGMICNKTTPQLLTTQTAINKTSTMVNTTATATQCTHQQMQRTQQTVSKTDTAIQHTDVATKKTGTEVKKTDVTIQKTATTITKTPTQMSNTTTTTMVHLDVNCMACHHHDQPTGIHTARHRPMMPLPQQPKFPQMVSRPQQFPMPLPQRMPGLPPFVGPPGMPWPSMVAKQPMLPIPTFQPTYLRPPLLPIDTSRLPMIAMPTPTLKYMDLPAFLRTPDAKAVKPRLDPLVMTTSAKQPVTIDRLPLIVDGSPDTASRMSRKMNPDLFDPLVLEEQGPARSTVNEFVLPLSDEDLLQPPTRPLPAAVIQLPPLPVQAAEVLLDEEELLPPMVEPSTKHNPLDLFGSTAQPAPRLVAPLNPNQTPALIQPGLPTDRVTELTPG